MDIRGVPGQGAVTDQRAVTASDDAIRVVASHARESRLGLGR
jgi:hypothetical protein